MKFPYTFQRASAALLLLVAASCGSTRMVATPVENIDSVPYKVTELTEYEKQNWVHLDLTRDTIPGMSVDRAYEELLKGRKGKTVIVAILDSGMDLEHEDLDDVLWTNEDEKPGNGIDDDNNGYVDDIHGYNFLGESYNEQLEFARILRLKLGDEDLRFAAATELNSELPEAQKGLDYWKQVKELVSDAHDFLKGKLGKEDYSKEELGAITPANEDESKHIFLAGQVLGNYGDTMPEVLELVEEALTYFNDQVAYNLNTEFNGREGVGDNPYDINDRGYGNGDPNNRVKDESHGTHVAGIVAGERDEKGMKGVANNVLLMSIRAVPNGDEYDKDIALGIRYAVDNGAKIINCSFGKSFSPNAEWVYDAIKYAASRDVLIVHAAGNDGQDLDDPNNPNFPNDQVANGNEFADNVITVGALTSSYGSDMVASFSNYGKINVDIFAPGDDVYSSMPENEYEFQGGTSMAAPAVAGVAALIRSHYPELTAAEVKSIIMDSGLPAKQNIAAGESTKPFSALSVSGKMANAYNALILADQRSRTAKRAR